MILLAYLYHQMLEIQSTQLINDHPWKNQENELTCNLPLFFVSDNIK